MNAAEAYYWVLEHPKMQCDIFQPNIEMVPQLVNPLTKKIDDDESKNTEVNWWIEAGAYEYDDHATSITPCHDLDLDCGGTTIDEALRELVRLVREKYGDYDPKSNKV